jgi:hypothetical protein
MSRHIFDHFYVTVRSFVRGLLLAANHEKTKEISETFETFLESEVDTLFERLNKQSESEQATVRDTAYLGRDLPFMEPIPSFVFPQRSTFEPQTTVQNGPTLIIHKDTESDAIPHVVVEKAEDIIKTVTLDVTASNSPDTTGVGDVGKQTNPVIPNVIHAFPLETDEEEEQEVAEEDAEAEAEEQEEQEEEEQEEQEHQEQEDEDEELELVELSQLGKKRTQKFFVSPKSNELYKVIDEETPGEFVGMRVNDKYIPKV